MLQVNRNLTNFLQEMDRRSFETLDPIAELQPGNREKLLSKLRGFVLEPNSRVSALETQNWLLYLLDGVVERIGSANGRETVRSKTDLSRHPLFSAANVRGAEIVARSRAELVGFDRRLFEVLRAEDSDAGTEVGHIEASEAESLLFEALFADYSQGKLDIPSMPKALEKVQAMLARSNVGNLEIAEMILADPGLAARVVRAASEHRGDGNEVDSLLPAVEVLGREKIREICLATAEESLCSTQSEVILRRMRANHEHSLRVAVFSTVLAEKVSGLNPQRAALAGLLHDVGVFPVLRAASHNYDAFSSEQELDRTVSKLHGVIGGLVLQQWGFGSWMTQVSEQADNWTRNNVGPIDDADIVLVAQLHSFIGTDRIQSVPQLQGLPAYRKFVGGSVGTDFSIAVFKQARARFARLQDLLLH
ncbi:MAG: HDOD domain-containing protein [Chromatiales bacterium]|nr:HDOD domain-containing protein [Chromatiales bacterium]